MIGEKIKQIRKANDMSISELAQRANVAKSYLSSIERNVQTNPSIRLLEKLSRVLNVSVNEFLTHSPEKSSPQLDEEWLEIVKEAMNSGVSKERFRDFLEFNKWKNGKKILKF